MSLHLMRPEWLWSLLPAVLLFVLLWRRRGRSGSWSSVIAPELLPYLVGRQTGSRSPNLLPLVLLGWILAALAASGPSWQKLPQPVHQKQDALVIVLDLSYSMKSGDLAPSRLDRVRQKLLDLLALRREGQTGLIAYAGDAHIVTPLTDDTPTIANLLPALNPDMMPVPGSEPAAAVSLAVDLLHSAGIRDGKILLITDGIKAGDSAQIEDALASSGAAFAVIGVGTATGAPIPLPRGGFLKDQSGTIVMPSLDERALRKLTANSGGRYLPLQLDNSDIEQLLADSALPGREPTLALDRTADTWEDQGYLLVLPLLPLVLALFRRGWIICLLPLLLFGQPEAARADAWTDLWLTPDQQGQRALQQGDNGAAAALFENPAWAGTAQYREGAYAEAAGAFARDDDADSWYNRGNALAKAGKLDEALEAYRESLERAPGREDASDNIALLEQLKQQQEQQQEQQDQQQNQDGQQDQEQDQEQGKGQDQQQDQGQDGQQDQQQNQGQDGQQDQQQDQGQDGQQDQQQNQGQDGQQDQQQDQGQDGQQDQQQNQGQDGQQDQQQTSGQATDEQPATEQEAQASAGTAEEQERDQAMEQWLRRVPDDPSGLLREKFRYESYQRQQQGATRDNETYW